jgi:spore coat protein CotH
LNYEQAIRVYAADAVLPNGDGSWGGGLNFYVYDDPIDGKFWLLPWDMDNTFERFDDPPNGEFPTNPDPVVWERWKTHGRPWFDAAIDDDDWFDFYIAQIDDIYHQAYTLEKLHARIDAWTAQIEDAVLTDENKPWSNEQYYDEVEQLYEYVDQHHDFLEGWLDCWKQGGKKGKDGLCKP